MSKIITVYLKELEKTDVFPPHKALEELGITFEVVTFKILLGCWMFIGCENVPTELPTYMHLQET